jgi:WD40 repeat protein
MEDDKSEGCTEEMLEEDPILTSDEEEDNIDDRLIEEDCEAIHDSSFNRFKVFSIDAGVSAMCMNKTHAYIGCVNGDVRVFDILDKPSAIGQLNNTDGQQHTHRITSIVYCESLDMLITSSADKTVRVWNQVTGETVRLLEGHTNVVACAAVVDIMYV